MDVYEIRVEKNGRLSLLFYAAFANPHAALAAALSLASDREDDNFEIWTGSDFIFSDIEVAASNPIPDMRAAA